MSIHSLDETWRQERSKVAQAQTNGFIVGLGIGIALGMAMAVVLDVLLRGGFK